MKVFCRWILVAGSLVWSTATLADVATTSLPAEGTYQTQGESHYQDGVIQLSAWADELVMTATLLRDGRAYDVEANLTPSGDGRFDGSGFITVRYENGSCAHRFGVIAFVQEDGIYLRENTPGLIPYNPNGACGAAGLYVWRNHAEPYVFQETQAP